MASQCKRQQCTIDRRGFRQELDSWRHKLIHCVGFESILEGLFGPELVEDLKLFKDLEPVAASDWSFDENCQFCCLRRDKVKEHLIGLNKEELQDTLRPQLAKDHAAISKLEKQAEEFLNAVLSRKDVPSFSDPHIPVVAREILQRMIRQFAAEYTSKTSPPQDSCSDNQPSSDQSLPNPQQPPSSPAAVVAGPAHSQNPVLSKLLMADQDAPLDLTIKKPQSEPSEQDGVLDLSIKKNRNSSSAPVRSPCLYPLTSTLKGESQDLRLAKAKELQSTPSLEQFIAKLCTHHQRQIVSTLAYLQTELQALSSTPPSTQKAISSTAKPSTPTPVKLFGDIKALCTSTPKVELQDVSVTLPSVKKKAHVSLMSAVNTSAVAADLPSPRCKKLLPAVSPVETSGIRQSDHVPLKMKIMKTSNVATGKKLSCVLTTSISADLENSEDRADHAKGIHSARLSSSSKKQNHSSHLIKKTFRHCKDVPASPFTVHAGVPMDLPRTARKSIRAAMEQNAKECAQRIIVDPDIGQCDIVYINKPITECFKEPQRHMTPRRNARKSTRGHLYSDDIWVVKTVRTLAGRGNCPNPMPDLITLVTPKQTMSKPESVPPVDTPFVGTCVETVVESGSTDNMFDRAIAGSEDVVEVAVSEADVGVETSQTDQQLTTQDADPQPLVRCDTKDDHVKASAREGEENATPVNSKINSRTERKEGGSTDSTATKQLEDCGDAVVEVGKTLLSSGDVAADDSGSQSDVEQLSQEAAGEVIQEERQGLQEENQPQENQAPDTCENVPRNVQAIPTHDSVSPVHVMEVAVEDVKHVSSKTIDEALPPSLTKSGSVSVAPEQVEVIVGYVNGKPVSASDRSLRHKLPSGPLTTKTEKANSKKAPTMRAVTALSSAVEGNPSYIVPALPQRPAQVLDKPSCLKSQPLVNVKQIKREKRKLSDSASVSEQPESKRQLRSASQKATAALPSNSKLQTTTKKPSLPSTPTVPNSELSTSPLEAVPSPRRDVDQVSSSSATSHIESTETEAPVSAANPSEDFLSSAPLLPSSPVKPSDGLDSSPIPSASSQMHDEGTTSPSHQPSASSEESSLHPPLISSPTPEAPKLPIASSSKKPSMQPSHETDKSRTNPEETFKSKRLQAKQRLRAAKASENGDPGTKPSSPLPPPIPPPTSGADELRPASAPSKSTVKDTRRDEEKRFEAKQKLRSAKAGEHLGSSETGASPPQPSPSQSSPGGTSRQPLDQTGLVQLADSHIDKSESSLPKLRSARLREDAEHLKATGEKSAVGKHETESVAIKCSDHNETERKDVAQTPSEAASAEPPASVADKPTRMPLRSESSKAERSLHAASDSQKPNLRSQRHPASDTSDASSAAKKLDFGSPNRMIPKKTPRVVPRSPASPVSSVRPQLSPQTVSRSRSEPCKKADKFFELLNREENKQLLTNLNIRFDKMQKGWVQLDKESQPGTKSKHKADRQAVIWKSKRRIRKPKVPEHQKYSPVQMLFMRGFDLSSICRWFLESTETKSLVIVKKVNTRLPSETQLCFHGAAGSSGGSLGVFPSLQAERLKKHLKKFAIASPVKSNPKSQKLIAKVLGLEARKRDPPSSSQTPTKSRMSAQIPKQKSQSQIASKSKNPTSARILRKYSNIRGKMQVQHTGARLQDTSRLKAKNVKTVAASKTVSKSNPKLTMKSPKNPASKQAKDSTENSKRIKQWWGKTSTKVLDKAVKVQKTKKAPTKNTKTEFPKRCSQRIGSPKLSPRNATDSSRNKPEQKESEKREMRKSPLDRLSASKVQPKQTAPNPDTKKNNVVAVPAEQSADVTPAGDQVLTRSQKKMEAAAPQATAKKSCSTLTRAARSGHHSQTLAARSPMTRSGARTKARPVSAGPSAAKKAKKRALEILSTPAKRTRISLSK
ncbi:uncharacterized protein ACB058_010767 isoform 1-T1 [Synchiropus picturatus]